MNYKVREVQGYKMVILDHDDRRLIIPCEPGNADYQKYLEWLDEGNTPEPWNPEENK
jgi:hypothetical protein